MNEIGTEGMPSIPGYEMIRPLGKGGMAEVFLAREVASGRNVALKLTHPHLANEADFVTRFLQEVKASHGLGHENVVGILGHGEHQGRYFLATEYVPGGSLQSLLAHAGKLPTPIAIALAAHMLRGLGHAHEHGVVHRDVKPANLLLSISGVLKVCDFGIARTAGNLALTQTGNLIGTPAYMSPEQASGQPLDSRSDLFSAGIVFYETLTGKNPFQTDNQSSTILRILQSSAGAVFEVDPTIPPIVERVLDRLLERDPGRRYALASEALADLAPILDENASRYPGLVAEYLKNRGGVTAYLAKDQSARLFAEAMELASAGAARRPQASLLLYRAALLDPTNAEILAHLKDLCAASGIRFGAAQNPKIAELEQVLAEKPDAPGIVQQLAQLHRMEGNLFQAIVYFKRYLKIRPNDSYAASQLSILTGEVPAQAGPAVKPSQGARQLSTGSISAGIKTGGFKSANTAGTGGTTGPSVMPLVPSDVVAPLPSVPVREPGPMDYLRALAGSGLGKVLALMLALLVFVAVVRRVGRWIDAATQQVEISSEQMNAQAEAIEDAGIERDAKRDVETRRADFDAAAKTELEAALSFHRAGDHAAAAAAFERYAVAHPNRREDMARNGFALGKSYLALRRHAEAEIVLSTFLEASAGSPDYPEALLRRGQARSSMGRHTAAAQDFTALLGNHGGSLYATEALVSRGEAWAAADDRASAAADMRNALARLGPADPLYTRAATALQALGEPLPEASGKVTP